MVLSADELALNVQIRKLSVKRITSPLVYDNLKNAVPNGLYDAAMGPMETHDRWAAFARRFACCTRLAKAGLSTFACACVLCREEWSYLAQGWPDDRG
jgi:hypothetical protein